MIDGPACLPRSWTCLLLIACGSDSADRGHRKEDLGPRGKDGAGTHVDLSPMDTDLLADAPADVRGDAAAVWEAPSPCWASDGDCVAGALLLCLSTLSCGLGLIHGINLSGCVTVSALWRTYPLGDIGGAPRGAQYYEAWIQCMETAESCDDVGRCLNAGDPAETCDPFEADAMCAVDGEGQSYDRHCAGLLPEKTRGITISLSCSAAGTSCFAWPGGVDCALSSGCTSVGRWCEGEHAFRCGAAGLLREGDCSTSGLVCRDGLCVGELGECPSKTSPHTCDGTRARYCNEGWDEVDCAQTRVATACESGTCASSGSECDAYFAGTCDGTRLSYCLDGTVAWTDCAAFGFIGCVADPVARCTR
jgi:hypothetical protein